MTKYLLSVLLALLLCNDVTASVSQPKFDFRAIQISHVVQVIYSEALKDSYVIDPEVLMDTRLVSFRYESNNGDFRTFVSNFFDAIGLNVSRRNGIDFVSRKSDSVDEHKETNIFVYRPRYRDGSYLVDIVSPLVKGSFTSNRSIHAPIGSKVPQQSSPAGSAAATIDRHVDMLVFSGSMKEIEMLKQVLTQVDTPIGEVMVQAVLYEVATSEKDGSAFTLALNILGNRFTLGVGSGDPLSSFVRFKNQSIDAVFSALSTDNRFKVVSTPSLRVRSGGTGRFTVGQDVPVIGAISYPGNGQTPVQSVEYRSSGVIFDLQPQVHDSIVDLDVSQQMSNFVVTDTGVNNSPTLIKRELKTTLSVADGDVVVLGGVAENKESLGSNGLSFMPNFLRSKNSETSKSEILLILQLTRINNGPI